MSTCEWNPATSEPAKTGEPGHAEAVLRVGSRRSWHLCQSCADLPDPERGSVRTLFERAVALLGMRMDIVARGLARTSKVIARQTSYRPVR